MADILKFPTDYEPDKTPDEMLTEAAGILEDVVIIGWSKGGELYVASSSSNPPDVSWLLKMADLAMLAAIKK